MMIGNGVGFMGKSTSAIGRKGFLFALALAGMGIQGCLTDDATKSAEGTESPATELDAAAQTSAAHEVVKSALASDGCRLYTVVADDGSEIRSQAYISCDHKMAKVGVNIALWRMKEKGGIAAEKYRYTECKNVYWCGTGNIYLPDPSGKQSYEVTGEYWKNGTNELGQIVLIDEKF